MVTKKIRGMKDATSKITIIYAHGIGNGMINWKEKWLIDRRQRVIVDGEVSN